ncbi:hypothetical protein EDC44_10515 [Cricetibacter osteomyelitidis]|uniref:Uncharacterized protein n=1 Tax=Cricetibacter osteomyelitidis TaxID=1521931 RepID=A0A4R2T2K1_9PAST|nr:hypothetical protein EDC44_10515 [Cricetibacter osteomyelitidis]
MARRKSFFKRTKSLSLQRRTRRMHHIKYRKSLILSRHALHFMMQQ